MSHRAQGVISFIYNILVHKYLMKYLLKCRMQCSQAVRNIEKDEWSDILRLLLSVSISASQGLGCIEIHFIEQVSETWPGRLILKRSYSTYECYFQNQHCMLSIHHVFWNTCKSCEK